MFDVAEGEVGDGGGGESTEAVAKDFFEAEAGDFEAAGAAAAEDDAGPQSTETTPLRHALP